MSEKRIFARVLFFSLVVAILFASYALAQEDFDGAEEEVLESEEEVLVEDRAGITPDSPLYVFDKAIDEVQLRVSSGEEKAKKALEIKEERLAEASVMVDSSKADNAKDALLLAAEASKVAQAEIAPDLEKEANEKVRKAALLLTGIKNKLPGEGWEEIEAALEMQLDEEEKTRIAIIVSKSRLSYCDSLAKQDFALMKSDQQCDIEKAPGWLKGKVEGEFKQREDNARSQIFDAVSACVLDPKQCDCSKIPVAKHAESCGINKALAIRCEYENDFNACTQLDGKKDDFKDILGKEKSASLMEMIKKKEKKFFDKMKPPECADAETFEGCFGIMKGLYGLPPFCDGMGDEECMEKMKGMSPEEMEGQMPPECSEAGVANPRECGKLMMDKYGRPPECSGLGVDECLDLMMKRGPEHVGGVGMPPECEEAGVTSPRDCFNIMMEKYGKPPFCEGLSDDECFEESMRQVPQGGPESNFEGGEPPECEEKGIRGKDCFYLMYELYGQPQECEGMDRDECMKVSMRTPPKGGLGACVGLAPEECRKKMQENFGMPPECNGVSQQECIALMHEKGGVPEGVPIECAGLEQDECERVMMDKYAPRECRGIDREACDKLMRERQGDFNKKFDGEHSSVVEVCEGLSRGECDQRMMERFAPSECEGLSPDECGRLMEGRRADYKAKPEFRQPPEEGQFQNNAPEGIPRECGGLSPEECGRLMNERVASPEQRFQSGVMPEEAGAFHGDRVERMPQGIPEERSGFQAESPPLPRESYERIRQQAPIETIGQEREFDRGFNEPVQQEASREFSVQQPQPEQSEPEPRHEGESRGGEVLNGITGSIVKIAEWLKK